MKKFLLATALTVATATAMAGSATIEVQDWNGTKGSKDAVQARLSVRENITKGLDGDVVFANTKTDGTNALTTRLEAGLTGSKDFGLASGYIRGAVGEKYMSGSPGFSYYSVEPGFKVPFGATTATVGYRFRSAFSDSQNDTTRTWRAGLSYALTKQDSVGIRYDRMRGDYNANIVAVNYTRGF